MESIKKIHEVNPLLYMIDTAPIFLGLFALLGGISKKRSLDLLDKFRHISEILQRTSAKLDTGSKNVTSEISNHTDILVKNTKDINDLFSEILNITNQYEHVLEELKLSTNVITQKSMDIVDYKNQLMQSNLLFHKEIDTFLSKIKETNSLLEKVNDIGKEINILSINAGIESNKMGKQGQNFLVISRNIKELSDKIGGINKNLNELSTEFEKGINVLQQKVTNEQELIKTLSDISESIESNSNKYNNSFNLVSDTFATLINNSSHQKNKLSLVNDMLLQLENTKNKLVTFFSESIHEETKIVKKINDLSATNGNR